MSQTLKDTKGNTIHTSETMSQAQALVIASQLGRPINLANVSLPGIVLTAATVGTNQPSSMAGGSLAGSTINNVIFRNMDMRGVDFTGTNLKGTDLRECNLDGAAFTGAVGDAMTRLPAGWHVNPNGSISRS